MQNQINLTVERFQENGQDYYVATSPDIQGLVAEADTIDEVIDIAKDLIPILLELQTDDSSDSSVKLTTANQFYIPLLVS
ncbi:DUF1902 domain-containing protein [Crocosphaera sp.]|uniref:type II toxin-antitoxin system HicB family antitoxin n=1 Tax=Crocosphaera sp. TaxID=2729996 RepID=UPI002617F8C1|nr:DUF1902 domain-containing protein [Crocosphaera sp.]MDJ0581905.1 DUF1902 domain-containing protein [Crocosphaera sp.]